MCAGGAKVAIGPSRRLPAALVCRPSPLPMHTARARRLRIACLVLNPTHHSPLSCAWCTAGSVAAMGEGTGPREPPRCGSSVSSESGRCVGRVPCRCRVHLCPFVSGVACARCFAPAVCDWCARTMRTELQRRLMHVRHGPERPQPSLGTTYVRISHKKVVLSANFIE